ncbi:hypothetical protein BN1708_020015, partial [Verticillium longisporum]
RHARLCRAQHAVWHLNSGRVGRHDAFQHLLSPERAEQI